MVTMPVLPLETLTWVLTCQEPWTRFRALVELLGAHPDGETPMQLHKEVVSDPQVRSLITKLQGWGSAPIARHNDAAHALHLPGVLADFGLTVEDPGIRSATKAILRRLSPEGIPLSPLNIARAFGGTGKDTWTWILCDAPVLLAGLRALGVDERQLQPAADQLADQSSPDGWTCRGAPELHGFRGPGRKGDMCPIATLHALRALSLFPCHADTPATRAGTEALLRHWQERGKQKHYLFGIGTDFAKLKYPFIWYDVLNVLDGLSRFPWARQDSRFRQMLECAIRQMDGAGRCTAGSIYRAWKDWSFGDKKAASPWITTVVWRIVKRCDPAAIAVG
jgi:hypothetical protein